MPEARHVAVIDIGKTNAKLVLVDVEARREIAVRTTPNRVITGPPYPHFDTEALFDFILAGLRSFQADHGVSAIVPTTHGAAAALIDAEGRLAAPVLDYEHDGPDRCAEDYDAIRPGFEETGSPRLPLGLNLGAQLFWQFATVPEIARRTAMILTYPQYWAYRLCGVATAEVTSLGAHSDLWAPAAGDYSTLVERQGWWGLMPPLRRAGDRLGPVTPEIAALTGLAPDTPVFCGIHDSNASLHAHLLSQAPPFAVVSTGTWVIAMAVGGRQVQLDPRRDTLMNVNLLGHPVPSAKFMGGREFDIVMAGRARDFSERDVANVVARGAMLLPSIEPLSGPFPGRRHSWSVAEDSLSDGERAAAVSLYLALMTATGLSLAGAQGPVLLEGPLASNPAYRAMLSAASGLPVRGVEGTGTSIGAALLASTMEAPSPGKPPDGGAAATPLRDDAGQAALSAYAARWRATVG